MRIVSVFVGLAFVCPALAQEEDDIFQAFGSTKMISIATGYERPMSEAPAVASVITHKDTEAIAATTIAEVLETVTGLHVSKNRTNDDLYFIRSIASELNPHILFMINGFSVGDSVQGGRPVGWSLPVQNISRIEIIRGPGSALYGADAFAGTINIVTKSADEIGKVRMGMYGGSFDQIGGWVQGSRQSGEIEAAFSFETRTTNGHSKIVKADAQTINDLLMGTRASLAPGSISSGRTDVDARADLKFGKSLRWRTGYQGHYNVGNGIGSSFALDQSGNRDLHIITSDLTHEYRPRPKLMLESKLGIFHERFRSLFVAFPPGAFGAFPEGVRSAFDYNSTELRGQSTLLYSGQRHHTVRAGIGFTYQRAHGTRDRRNFMSGPGGIPIPAPGFLTAEELGVTPNALPVDRGIAFGFIQDEWKIRPDWTLTLGARLDRYSDFGTTINPRASLVWAATPTLTLKALYGRAFRPPTFLEGTEGAGQLAIGNPNLEPETIDTVEFEVRKKWSDALSTSANVYAYRTKDLITIVSNPITGSAMFENSQGTEGYGVEAEVAWSALKKLQFKSNYAFQTAKFRRSSGSVGYSPKHQLYGEVRWQATKRFATTLGLKYVGPRKRPEGDPREKLDGYVWGDLTARYQIPKQERVHLSFSIDNLFNVEAREPSTSATFLPYDIPLQGRSFIAKVGVRF